MDPITNYLHSTLNPQSPPVIHFCWMWIHYRLDSCKPTILTFGILTFANQIRFSINLYHPSSLPNLIANITLLIDSCINTWRFVKAPFQWKPFDSCKSCTCPSSLSRSLASWWLLLSHHSLLLTPEIQPGLGKNSVYLLTAILIAVDLHQASPMLILVFCTRKLTKFKDGFLIMGCVPNSSPLPMFWVSFTKKYELIIFSINYNVK